MRFARGDVRDPSQTLTAGRGNRDFDRRATNGGLFFALKETNGPTNFKQLIPARNHYSNPYIGLWVQGYPQPTR